jgi:hypothetical protein
MIGIVLAAKAERQTACERKHRDESRHNTLDDRDCDIELRKRR